MCHAPMRLHGAWCLGVAGDGRVVDLRRRMSRSEFTNTTYFYRGAAAAPLLRLVRITISPAKPHELAHL
jgi:hypothetical protein